MSYMLELMHKYEIWHRIHLGHRNLVICYDHIESEKPYMTCYHGASDPAKAAARDC